MTWVNSFHARHPPRFIMDGPGKFQKKLQKWGAGKSFVLRNFLWGMGWGLPWISLSVLLKNKKNLKYIKPCSKFCKNISVNSITYNLIWLWLTWGWKGGGASKGWGNFWKRQYSLCLLCFYFSFCEMFRKTFLFPAIRMTFLLLEKY